MSTASGNDRHIDHAAAQVVDVLHGDVHAPQVKAFFDEPTFTVSYVVSDAQTKRAAIIDSVWNFDQASGRTSFDSADKIVAYVEEQGLKVDWILETHAHADHLSAAPYLQQKLGGKMAIGREIVTVQGVFGKISTRALNSLATGRSSIACSTTATFSTSAAFR